MEVEKKWLKKIYNFSKSAFLKCNLPSHDHTHHLRVWNYCKEIIISNSKVKSFLYFEIENIIIAALFHDIGMIKTVDIKHGVESRKICEEFFRNYSLPQPVGYKEILSAIERHDDKSYKAKDNDSLSTLSILSIADDLDAFGIIGVLRYTEIYYLRNPNIYQLPNDILKNLDIRYNNFIAKYPVLTEFNKIHTIRYKKIQSYFVDLEREMQNYSRNENNGAIGFLNFVIENFIKTKNDIESFSKSIISDDIYINRINNLLQEELKLSKEMNKEM
ncbi:MAG: HD domain-containing protein [Bacteroidota bacterium]|nr:HD domain-containing protein [Bacteroidota bacterium]